VAAASAQWYLRGMEVVMDGYTTATLDESIGVITEISLEVSLDAAMAHSNRVALVRKKG
jgi:hypothetical protein